MKVLYRVEYRPGERPEYTYFETDTDFCCKQMKEAWNEVILFSASNYYTHLQGNYVNIRDDSPFPANYSMKFCPFCGEVIETIEVERKEFTKKIVEIKVKREIEEEK